MLTVHAAVRTCRHFQQTDTLTTTTMFVATVFCFSLAISAAAAAAAAAAAPAASSGTLAGTVLFTAVQADAQDIDGSIVIVYPKIITNHGNAYNPLTGVFTATKGGSYLFSFHGVGTSSGTFWIDLYNNEQYVNSAYGTTGYGSGGNTATFILKKGDRVYIRSRRSISLFAEPDQIYASFSGAIIGN